MVDASPSVPAAPVARMVDVVVPVFDETTALRPSIERLHAFMTRDFPFPWRISDNASTDGTAWEAARLARDLRQITVLHLDDKGRGRALRAAWTMSDASVVAHMDDDLSTGLDGLFAELCVLAATWTVVTVVRLALVDHGSTR